MKKYFYPLKGKEYISLSLLVLIAFGWLMVDQLFFSEIIYRFIALFILMLILFFMEFIFIKPTNIRNFANSCSLVALSYAITVSIIIHVFIRKDFSYRSVLIWIISGSLPYISGYAYYLFDKKPAASIS
jgi:hypothetical protein